MTTYKPTLTAKLMYRPVGLASSLAGGLVAGAIFKQIWKHASDGEHSDPPTPLARDYSFREIVLAAALQGLIFSIVKTVIDRQGAKAFARWTGEWPGE